MTVKIRPVVLADAASYHRCFNAVAGERRFFHVYKASPLSLVRANMKKRLRQGLPFLVAVDDERVVGWAALFRPEIPALAHSGDLVVGLLPAYRGQGLGTKLTAGVLRLARDKFDAVIFWYFSKNKAARKLSRKLGFEICGRQKKFVKLPSGFDDQIITQKRWRG